VAPPGTRAAFQNLRLNRSSLARQESSGITLKGESGVFYGPPRGRKFPFGCCVLVGVGDAMLHW
jgi:hypothetical protein